MKKHKKFYNKNNYHNNSIRQPFNILPFNNFVYYPFNYGFIYNYNNYSDFTNNNFNTNTQNTNNNNQIKSNNNNNESNKNISLFNNNQRFGYIFYDKNNIVNFNNSFYLYQNPYIFRNNMINNNINSYNNSNNNINNINNNVNNNINIINNYINSHTNNINNKINKEIIIKKKKKKKKISESEKIYKEILQLKKLANNSLSQLNHLKTDYCNTLLENLKVKLYNTVGILEINENIFFEKTFKIFKELNDINEQFSEYFLNSINYFIEIKIISVNNNQEIKQKSFDYFINNITKIKNNIYKSYINCFGIEENIFKYLENKTNISKFQKNSIIIVKLLKLQNNYSFKEFPLYHEKNDIDFRLIGNLFHTYNRSQNELNDLYNYFIETIPKNSIPYDTMIYIFENNTFDENYKKLLINNLLKLPENQTDIDYKSFYDFIFKNKLDNNCFQEIKEEKYINNLVFNLKFYNAALIIIQNLNKDQIKSLDKSLLKQILYSINIENIESVKSIKFLLELLPEEIDSIGKIVYEQQKDNYLQYLKKLFKEMNIKLINNVINSNINKFSDIINFDENKGFYLKEKRYKNPLNQFIKYKIKKNDNIFGPKTKNCFAFTKDEINVIFIQKYEELIKNFYLYFKNTEYIGIDTEWKEPSGIFIQTQTAIMQLSDYDGKNIFILDMIELTNDEKFEDIFQNLFNNKIFLAFGFKDDLEKLPNNIGLFFNNKAKIIDIQVLYELKYFKHCPSLTKVCNELFGKFLCKREQCSNWERRPLTNSQLHYAALDALFCCLIFKKLIDNNFE